MEIGPTRLSAGLTGQNQVKTLRSRGKLNTIYPWVTEKEHFRNEISFLLKEHGAISITRVQLGQIFYTSSGAERASERADGRVAGKLRLEEIQREIGPRFGRGRARKKETGPFLCLATKEFHSIRADRSFELNAEANTHTLHEFSFSLGVHVYARYSVPRAYALTRSTVHASARRGRRLVIYALACMAYGGGSRGK